MSSIPTPGATAFGLLLILLAIPVGLSLGPLVLGVVLAAIGLRRLHRGLSEGAASADQLALS
ncbi:MAG TPA: hypothetical protein VEY67_04645 [Candidatus Dormibacteraeota bacterium]|nr:hypothetical protein [Candidatus Dormibacteraeota bacterium]